MKKAGKILAVLLAIALVALIPMSAFAQGDEAILAARNGVVKVIVYYNNRDYYQGMGSAFLINEDTVVTANHVIADYVYEDDYGRQIEKRKVTKIEVVAVADVKVVAKVVTNSENRDFAILRLKTKINGKTVLPLGAPEGFDSTSNVYALGFPQIKEYTSDKINYTAEDITVTSGSVSNISTHDRGDNVKVIQHSALIDHGNSGGPLMYSDGKTAYVVGMNSYGWTTSIATKYNYSIHIDDIIEVLTALGIQYSATSSTPEPTTEATTTATTTETTTKSEDDDNSSSFTLSTGAIIGIAAAAAVIIIGVVVIIIISKKKKAAEPQTPSTTGGFTPPAPPAPSTNTPPAPPAPAVPVNKPSGSEGTTVLSENASDPNATTVLSENMSTAYLSRLSNNERINITKPYFKIGKDANRVDYCITGNPAVSRFHASIVSKNGQFFIVDNSTTNHTYVNDSMIPANVETQISNGAKIKLADEKFEFKC